MKAPEHLSPAARRHWRRILDRYELTPDALMLLQSTLEHWDLARRARESIALDGLIVNRKRNEAYQVFQNSTSLFMRGLARLGLDIEEPMPTGRPPNSI